MPFQSFSYQIINISPQKLHDQDEHTDKKSGHERTDKAFKHKQVELLHL